MSVLWYGPRYNQPRLGEADRLPRPADNVWSSVEVTTDPEEGRRQIEAMKPEPLKVGDKVRLSAGGEREMRIADLKDYGNVAMCWWYVGDGSVGTDDFPARSLVRVDE